MGDEAFFANDTLIPEITGVVLHVLIQLHGSGKRSFAMLATVRFLFVMDEFDMRFQLECLRKRFVTEHANMWSNFCMHSGVVLL